MGGAGGVDDDAEVEGGVEVEVEELLARSHRLGADPRNTNYGGGNTSTKGTGTDPVTGGTVDLLWVKGSGGDLGTLQADGLAVLRLGRLRALAGVYPGEDREDDMVGAFDFWPHTSTTCIPTAGSPSPPPPTASG
jgi:rhamnose utilization protein RhaD (predicted bifunctional aldolase and dehydrogenase)